MKFFAVFALVIGLSLQSCSKEFVDDCKDAVKSVVNVKVEPPKGCSENELLK